MSLRAIQIVLSAIALATSLVFFIQMIQLIPQGNTLWPIFILYWMLIIAYNVVFVVRTETEPKFRKIVSGEEI